MNLLLIREEERAGQGLWLQAERARHVREVLRCKVGDTLRVAVARESVGTARVAVIDAHSVVLDDLQLLPLGAAPSVRLILALPRPKALRKTLQTAASFGVDHIDLVNAWRVSKSYWSSPSLAPQALEAELRLGCEQGRNAWLPTITSHRLLVPFLRELGETTAGQAFLAHPGSETWFSDVGALRGRVMLAIGPEGGWIEPELASFADAGFQKIGIASGILRSEIALAAALAQIEMARRTSRG